MLLFDTILYFILTWYIEKVRPGEFGIALPLYFPLQPSFWCGSSRLKAISAKAAAATAGAAAAGPDFEPPPPGLRAGVQIRNLRKVFHVHGQKKVAVDDLTLEMFEGEVS